MKKPEAIYTKKVCFFANLVQQLDSCFSPKVTPSEILHYFQYVASLEYDQDPDYNKCRKLFLTALGEKTDTGPLFCATTSGQVDLAPPAEIAGVLRGAVVASTKGVEKKGVQELNVKR
jgi:hypothetical protein